MKTNPMTPALYEYVLANCPLPHPILSKVEAETRHHPYARMQISRDQGAFMHFLAKTMNAQRIIEIGCFTGYSAICMASALSTDGKLYTLDLSQEHLAQAGSYFTEAGLRDRIVSMHGPALQSLETLNTQFGAGTFDMAFIDADKTNMPNYFEKCLQLLRPGGVIVADNVLWSGRVLGSAEDDADTQAIQTFNLKVANDERVDRVLLHISDGLYLARKR